MAVSRAFVLSCLLLGSVAMSPALALSEYHRGSYGEAGTLDPGKISTVPESDVVYDLLEGLLSLDAKANPVAGAAISWTISDDGLVYRFKMRPEARWSNGDKVKAGDFAFSFRRTLDPQTASEYANVLFPIKNAEKFNKGQAKAEELGVKAIDDDTLEITLEGPTPYFLALMAHPTSFPVNPGAVEKYGKDFVKPGNMVSNGAYKLVSFTPKDRIVLEKDPNFYDAARVSIDKVIVYPLEDLSAAMRRFEAGELDCFNEIPADQVKYVRSHLKDEFKVNAYLGTYYFVFNMRKKPFDDIRVRQALSMAVDRDYLAETIWAGTMLPAYDFVPPGIGNFTDAPNLPYQNMSPIEREDKAKALLKEAGFGPDRPLELEIRYNTGENHKNTSLALAEMWKPLGVTVHYVNSDIKSHYNLLKEKGDFDVARAGWIADYNDPQSFLFLGQSDNNGLNYASYANPKFDTLMAEAAKTGDLDKRAKILAQADGILNHDEPYLTLLTYEVRNLISKKVSGWQPNILDRHLVRYLKIDR